MVLVLNWMPATAATELQPGQECFLGHPEGMSTRLWGLRKG